MNDTAYTPHEVTIKQGEKIVFENVGKNDRWPASDIHPTHTAYPGSDINLCGHDENIFDACGAIEPGESFEYTFTKIGQWRCHDHIEPSLGCIINVELNPDFVEKLTVKDHFKIWQKSLDDIIDNFKTALLSVFYKMMPSMQPDIKVFDIAQNRTQLNRWLKILGPEEIMNRLLQESNGGADIDCHTEAHLVGRAAYELFGGEVFEKGDASCHSGFYHGAMEALLATKGTNNLAQTVSDLCATFKSQFGNFECLHGVGHGVMAYVQYDLPEAINQCTSLQNSFEQSSCYGGVFMENVVAGQGNGAIPGHETDWVSDDMQFPCTEFADNNLAATECYKMQTSWMLTLADYDFQLVAKECLNALPTQISNCFLSFGRDSAGFSLRDPKLILQNCQFVKDVSPENYSICLSGALNVIVDFWGEKLTDQAVLFCNQVPAASQSGCYSEAANRLPGLFFDKTTLAEKCQLIPKSYQYNCQSG